MDLNNRLHTLRDFGGDGLVHVLYEPTLDPSHVLEQIVHVLKTTFPDTVVLQYRIPEPKTQLCAVDDLSEKLLTYVCPNEQQRTSYTFQNRLKEREALLADELQLDTAHKQVIITTLLYNPTDLSEFGSCGDKPAVGLQFLLHPKLGQASYWPDLWSRRVDTLLFEEFSET